MQPDKSNLLIDEKDPSKRYKWYVLFALTVVSTFAFLDKQLIIILQESIKDDLGLSDTQLGIVTGLAFALSYATFGIPIAQLADRFNRKKIISIALISWSAITAITGFANNFFQLFLARFGVGLGETGSAPPGISMIADYFPKSRRGLAYAVRSMGVYFGLLLGFLVGGLLDESYGWRTAFWLVGTPGVLFAIIFFLTVKEPVRGRLDKRIEGESVYKGAGILEVIKLLWSKKTMIYLIIGTCLHVIVGAAYANWMPPFFARIHSMGTAEIGIWLAFAIGVCGALGVFLGGHIGDKLSAKDVRWYLWMPMITFSLSLPFAFGVLFSPHKTTALLFYLIPNILYASFMGPCLALLQDMVKVNMRATASAIWGILIAFLGGGLGPFLAGLISDFLQADYGNESIRWALFIIGFLELPAILCYFLAAKTLKKDLID